MALGDGAGFLLQRLQPDAEIRLAVEGDVGGLEGFDARQCLQLEYRRLGNFRKFRRARRAELELVLQGDCRVRIGAEFDPGQHAGIFHRQIDARRSRGDRDVRAPEAHRELAERPLGKQALVDVGNRLAPAVEEVDGVIAALDLRHADDRATAFVDRDPRFGVGHVEIGIGPIHGAGLAMHQLVPFKAFLEIELLLTRDQAAGQEGRYRRR